MRKSVTSVLAGVSLALACGTSVHAQEKQLTIFWAEWDPSNYLQELGNEYEKETGVKVVVETTPWADFQTKAFAEFNAHGDAYDLVVGDSQWLGAASEGGHYVDLTDFVKENHVLDKMAEATVKYYAEYPGGSGKYWAIPTEGDAVGWAYRKDWFEDPKEKEAFKAKYGYDLDVPKTFKELTDIAEFFNRPDQNRYGIAIYTQNQYDGLAMGVENALFSYGADLGDYSTYKVDGVVNSDKAVAALENYRKLFGFTPPGWTNAFFVENNQAITEGLAAMSMNYFAFLPSLLNESTNPHAKDTGFFANPAGPDGKRFAESDVTDKKRLFAQHLLAYLPLIAHVRRVLDERPNHEAPRSRFCDELEDHMSPDAADRTIRTVINWGRFAEIFAYDDEEQRFTLENPS